MGASALADLGKRFGVDLGNLADDGADGANEGDGADGAEGEDQTDPVDQADQTDLEDGAEGADAGDAEDSAEGEEGADADGADDAEGEDSEEDQTDPADQADQTDLDGKANTDDPAATYKAAAALEVAKALKHLPPNERKNVLALVDKQLSAVVTKERAETTRLGSRVEELTTELATAQKAKGPTIVGGVSPLFMVDDEAAIDEHAEKIDEFLDWADANRDGSEAVGEEGQPGYQPAYTAEQIRTRARELRKVKEKVIPAARARLKGVANVDANLRTVFPSIFDPKSEDYKQAEGMLKSLPELKQFPDYRAVLARQILGARALAELLKQQKEKTPTGQQKQKPTDDPKKPKKPVPRAPGGGSPAKGGALPQRSKPAATKAASDFAANPTRANLAKTVASFL